MAFKLAGGALTVLTWLNRAALVAADWPMVEAHIRLISEKLDSDGLLDPDGKPRPALRYANQGWAIW